MQISVLIDEDIEGCPDESWLRRVAERVLAAQGVCSYAELGLVVTGQERVRELNKKYRDEDRPTDVLAFYMTPSSEETGAPAFITPPDGMLHLGEVIISYPQAVIQAKEHGHSVRREMAILIIHGVLHLLGYDHDKPELARLMRAREKEILNGMGEELDKE